MELQKVQRTTLTMKEAAEYLGISYWLINQLVRRKPKTDFFYSTLSTVNKSISKKKTNTMLKSWWKISI